VGTIRSGSAASATIDPHLGLAVALSADGTTALVGAPGVAGDRGAAYIFHASEAGSWSSSGKPIATLRNTSTGAGSFGRAVALSADGTTAFVSAPFVGAGPFGAGAIYVFHVSAEDAWASSSKPTAKLTVSSDAFDFGLGLSLALSADGTTLVAGAPFYNDFVGEALVFHVSSEDAWASRSPPTAILNTPSNSEDDVGYVVAISGDGTTALVSDVGNPSGGGAFIYHVSAESAWTSSSTPTAILTDTTVDSSDSFGNDLALSGDGTLAVISAPGADKIDVFHASGAAAWASTSTPTATLTDTGVSWSGDHYVVPVVVSTDGTTILVLALAVNAKRGAAYVFRASSEGAWASSSTPTATLTNAGAHSGDFLGAITGAFSADGATALIGAYGVRSGTGAAYVFHAADESSWATSSTPNAALTNDALAHCVVPKLRGLKLPAARHALAVGRCNLGRVTKVHSAHRKGRVLSQSRKAGTRLAIGAKVNVRLGR